MKSFKRSKTQNEQKLNIVRKVIVINKKEVTSVHEIISVVTETYERLRVSLTFTY